MKTEEDAIIQKELKKLEAAKKKPLADLVGDLHAIAKRQSAEPALLDLGVKVGGKDAYCRRISLSERQSHEVSLMTADGKVDYHKAAAQKALLLSMALCEKSGTPIYPSDESVDVEAELGEALWIVCARVNRIGSFRNTDPDTGEEAAGNSPPSKS